MKPRYIALAISLVAVICISSGLAAAVSQSDLTTLTSWSKDPMPAGNSVIVTITVQSNTDEQLQIYYFGVHFDWMAADTFAGQNLQSNPVTIPSHGSYQFTPSIINIPNGTSIGSHTYFIGIDGEDSDGNPFSWNSQEATIQVVASSTTSGGPDNHQNGDNSADWTLGIAVIAATAIVMVVIILIVLRRKRSAPAPAQTAEPAATQPEQPQPPQEAPASDQEFDI
ncbi:MAG: hypothetical protein NWE93_12360 [Candidatus Bathyarchaeota archaeon]|nr:hypothetical protein [Candidatus Bathyarchaeota archaeon]